MSINKNRPYFTIITATYNCATLLPRTADSLSAQDEQDFEWLVIDGSSSDQTLDEIRRRSSIITYWISEPDSGISDAWNKGLTRAAGSYVLFLNAGDTYDPDFLRRVRGIADGHRIVCSHARLVSESGRLLGIFRAQPRKLYRGMHVPHNWCAVPIQYYTEFGRYKSTALSMDFAWFYEYFRKYGVSGFSVIPLPLGSYHLGGKSDVYYKEGFRMNERIIVEGGGNPVFSRLYRLAYTFNHWLQRQRTNFTLPS